MKPGTLCKVKQRHRVLQLNNGTTTNTNWACMLELDNKETDWPVLLPGSLVMVLFELNNLRFGDSKEAEARVMTSFGMIGWVYHGHLEVVV